MQIESCTLCPRKCGVLRTAAEGNGFCGMGADAVVARAALHAWEEPCISGKKGSGTVFFSGCNLRCVFCQNYAISTERFGKRVSAAELSDIFRRLVEEQGAQNINLVTPTHFVPAICEALSLWKPPVPVIYNSSGYESVETLQRLEGLIDVYLPDLKYARALPAQQYSAAPDYFEVASAAISEMHRQVGDVLLDKEGNIRRGLIIRHLILPGNTKNAIAVLDWIAEHLPKTAVSLMAQYTPCGEAERFAELTRPITRREYDKVLAHLFALDLDGYVQQRSAAKKDFIPSFRLEGVEPSNSPKPLSAEEK